jgi:hypothetical protein
VESSIVETLTVVVDIRGVVRTQDAADACTKHVSCELHCYEQ